MAQNGKVESIQKELTKSEYLAELEVKNEELTVLLKGEGPEQEKLIKAKQKEIELFTYDNCPLSVYEDTIKENQENLDKYYRANEKLVCSIEEDKVLIKQTKKDETKTPEIRTQIINETKERIAKNKLTIHENKVAAKKLVKEYVKPTKKTYRHFYKQAQSTYKLEKQKFIQEGKEQLEKNKVTQNAIFVRISDAFKKVKTADKTATPTEKIELKKKLAQIETAYKNQKVVLKNLNSEAKSERANKIQKAKDEKHNSYLNLKFTLASYRNGKNSYLEIRQMKVENYLNLFELKTFLMKNGLYIIILLFMLVCIINSPTLISLNAISNIVKNFSTKIFFALGVAGLILFGGTDLSIGRIVTMGTMITCMMLNPGSTTEFFGISLSGIYNTIGFPLTALLALLFSILLSVLFSVIAGFFTAKFKIHPFITTLGTSLVIWGLVGYGTNNVKTGSVTDAASNLVKPIFASGSFSGIPLTFFYAIIAIIVVWFIWNKTRFGKNMYAVGGNSEAAAVSGISVFKTTMGIFALAGILYGVGSFLQGVTTGASSSSLGQGWELEAIAACVVGGISFSGGIGKVSGAVIGCMIFEILKYFLRDITGGSADITNIFIGLIIVAAVTFDSIKYLKKK